MEMLLEDWSAITHVLLPVGKVCFQMNDPGCPFRHMNRFALHESLSDSPCREIPGIWKILNRE
jgi:hypothetical protein